MGLHMLLATNLTNPEKRRHFFERKTHTHTGRGEQAYLGSSDRDALSQNTTSVKQPSYLIPCLYQPISVGVKSDPRQEQAFQTAGLRDYFTPCGHRGKRSGGEEAGLPGRVSEQGPSCQVTWLQQAPAQHQAGGSRKIPPSPPPTTLRPFRRTP